MAEPKQKSKRKPKRLRKRAPKRTVSPLDKYVPDENEDAPDRLTEDDLKWLL